MSSKIPLIELAYSELEKRKRPMAFQKLWETITKKSELSETKLKRIKGNFYAELMEDHRFVSDKENRWCLRKRKKFNETTIIIDDSEYIEYDEETDRELKTKDSEDGDEEDISIIDEY